MWTINPKFPIFKEKFNADIYIYCGQPTYVCAERGLYLGHLTAKEISDLVTKSVDEGVNYVAQNAKESDEGLEPVALY